MRISHIKIQQSSLLSLANLNGLDQVQQEIANRNNHTISQVSIVNSSLPLQFASIPLNIETLTIKKCSILSQDGFILGNQLRTIELQYCNIASIPQIQSSVLSKLNLRHNRIKQVLEIPCSQTLRVLDLRDNRLTTVSAELGNLPKLTLLHQFIPQKLEAKGQQFIQVTEILQKQICSWSNDKLVEVIEELISDNNEFIMQMMLCYLDPLFVKMIFEVALKNKKYAILDLLVHSLNFQDISLEQRVMLLQPSLLPYHQLCIVPLQFLIQAISSANCDPARVLAFLGHIESICPHNKTILQSEKDLINFMNFSNKYPHDFEAQFLLTQKNFFKFYDFSNQSILKYLLHLDHLSFVKELLKFDLFKEKIFPMGSFKQLTRPNTAIYKMLTKLKKQYLKEYLSSGTQSFFPEYRERKTFCIRNDLYDYQMLQQYEEMQGSYLRKDFKYTIKFYNKENEISVAKKIENQLKKSSLKEIRKKSRPVSISSIFI